MDTTLTLETTLRRMVRLTVKYFRWLPVAGGVIFLVLWIVAEAGRWGLEGKTVVFALFAVAIALSGFWPLVSLGMVTAIPVLQLLGILYPPAAQTWPMYEAAGFIAFVIAFQGPRLARILVLPVGVITALLFASRMMIPSIEEGYWTSWVGGTGLYFQDYPHREHFVTLTVIALWFYVAFWALGLAARSILRERAIGQNLTSAEVRLVETDFDLRLAEDRARISRDVHDALAHSLAVIVSQAEGAIAMQQRRPEVAGDALGNIAAVGRSALTDVRSLVERIHEQDLTAVAPRIDDLPQVVQRMRQVGMDATLQVLGTPSPLPAARELAVFRIVQESLTNALKHAGSTASARVTLDWQGPGLAVLVVSRPSGEPPTPAASRGVGIEGMKERARLAGGWLTADADGRDFLVTAFIPVSERVNLDTETAELVDA